MENDLKRGGKKNWGCPEKMNHSDYLTAVTPKSQLFENEGRKQENETEKNLVGKGGFFHSGAGKGQKKKEKKGGKLGKGAIDGGP